MLRPLDLPERKLLPLMRKAITNGVFSDAFLDDLATIISGRQR